jgi:translocation and assembly module TamB
MARIVKTFLIMCILAFSLGHQALAQESEEHSAFITFVENKLSADNRQIRLNGIKGTLSSNVSFDSITISDEDGVWLTITEPQLIWSRVALLRGRLEIEKLSATSIDMPRGPKADDSAPSAEASEFSLPELPVSINLEELDVPSIKFGPGVFGLESELAVNGAISLIDSSLTTDLDIVRLDGPGGSLQLDVVYNDTDKTVKLDLLLQEPEEGIIANLLDLDGKPPVALAVKGDAPIHELRVDIGLDVDNKRIVNGQVNINDIDEGRQILAELGGPLSSIMPPQYQTLLGDASRLEAQLLLSNAGFTQIDRLTFNSGAIRFDANARILADGFLSQLNLNAEIADEDGKRVALPNADNAAATRFQRADFNIAYDAANDDRFEQTLLLSGLQTTDVVIEEVRLATEGAIANFTVPENRSIEFITRGTVDGIMFGDEALTTAIGKAIQIVGSGSWRTSEALQLAQLDIEGRDYALRTNGALTTGNFDGQIGLEATRLSSFSDLLERELAGNIALVATGNIQYILGAFDLDLNGVANGIRTGEETADKLLDGGTKLSGGVTRNADGLSFDRLRILNNQADILLIGNYASDNTSITATADLRDIADISDAGEGAVSLVGTIKGVEQPYDTDIVINIENGTLSKKSVSGLEAAYRGVMGSELIEGELSGSGFIDGQALSLAGKVKRTEPELVLDNIAAKIGGADIALDLTRQNTSGLMNGRAVVKATDISSLAALALQDASGSLNADVVLTTVNNGQSAEVTATANNLVYADNKVGNANIDAQIKTLLKSPIVNADVSAREIVAGGIEVRSLTGNVDTDGKITDFDLAATMVQENARLTTAGRFEQGDNQQTINVDTLTLRSDKGDAALVNPARVTIRDGRTTISDARLNVAGGTIDIAGSVSDTINVTANISNLPLRIANAFSPGLGLGGSINGRVVATGTTAAPKASFGVDGSGITATQLQQNGISPLTLSVNGNFDGTNQRVSLNSLSVSNAQNVQIRGSGEIPLQGNGLRVSAEGTAPLGIAERFLADRGTRLSGQARFNVTATGSLNRPNTEGILSIAGGTVTDPLSNLRLENIGLLAGLRGDAVVVQRLNAQLARGGSVSGSGTVGITGDMPADLSIQINDAAYSDGQTFSTRAGGNLALKGNLLRDPVLSGQINLGKTEITVPETFGGDVELLDVKNVNPAPDVQRTLDRLAKASPLPKPSSRPSIIQLNLTINAPSQVFVRGRGLDAELGGRIAIQGPVTNVQPSGRFDLRRGRLSIIGKRFDLNEGSVTLTGDLDPTLRFVATTQSGDVTASIILSGRVSDLDVSFSSSPELPEDEVLAAIIFDRNIGELTPTQIARLASIAVELTGGNSPGLVDGIRSGLGFDDLDIVQDSDGNAAVRAGKYISDNVYLGVQAGQETEATINLDITESLTARGAVSSDGDTSLGVFFERDY